jgi:hypothetical protein
MSQATNIIPANQSGTQYRTDDNNALAAIISMHSGSSRPSYVVTGMMWANNSGSPNILVNLYDGTSDLLIGNYNTSTHVWTQSNNAQGNYAIDTGSANVYAITLNPAPAALVAGQVFTFKAAHANTNTVASACTLNVNALGAVTLKKNKKNNLEKGDILTSSLLIVQYDGTNMQVLGGLAQSSQVHAISSTYTVLTTDRGALLTFSNSGAFGVTLSQAGSGFEDGFYFDVQNTGVGVVTITPTTSTIDGASNITLTQNQGYRIFSNGTNYFTQRGAAASLYPPYYQASAPPVYVSTSSFTVANIVCMDSTNAYPMINKSSITFSTGTLGAVNGIAQNGTAPGTMSYTNGSASVTGSSSIFGTVYDVGNVVYDSTNSVTVGVIGTINSNTSITLTTNFSGTSRTGAAYRNGGLAPNHFYYLYAIQGTSGTGLLASDFNVAGGGPVPPLPSGYTYYQQLPFAFLTDSSSHIIPFYVKPGVAPFIGYRDTQYSVLSAGTQSSFTSVSCASYIPPISTIANIVFFAGTGSSGSIYTYWDTTGSGTGHLIQDNAGADYQNIVAYADVYLTSSQAFYYKTSSGGSLTALVNGFYVNLVP